MDMWEPYITVVGKKAPQARVIFDRFHIVKHLNEAVDKTRRELVRELKGTARRNLKNTKFPLSQGQTQPQRKDRVLREQVRANRRLYRAMLLRDDLWTSTVVIDHLSGRVVWAGKERKAKTPLRFFRKLGPQRAAELEAVSMDMWEPYITVVGKKAPQARVIFDRFHIVKHLNEAVDKTRRELVRELKGTARRNLKNTKFPLLKAETQPQRERQTGAPRAGAS